MCRILLLCAGFDDDDGIVGMLYPLLITTGALAADALGVAGGTEFGAVLAMDLLL